MSSTLTLLAQLGCLLILSLVLSQCTPARRTSLPPVPQPLSVAPPSPPSTPPVSTEELLNRFNVTLDRA